MSASPSTRSCAGCKSAASSPGWSTGRAPGADEESAAGMRQALTRREQLQVQKKQKRKAPRRRSGLFYFAVWVVASPEAIYRSSLLESEACELTGGAKPGQIERGVVYGDGKSATRCHLV